MAVELLICCSTEIEGAHLRARLLPHRADIAILRTGVGCVNAAHALTWFLSQHEPKVVLVCGVGGAYPHSGLAIGDVVCAETECYGDLGAESPDGFLDMQALGFAVIEGPPPVYNELALQVFPSSRRARFVTVNTCTGTDIVAAALETRTRGAVENMEGAAIAHVAHLHGIQVGEVRGISNMVGRRDKSSWRVKDAAHAAQEAVLAWLDERSSV